MRKKFFATIISAMAVAASVFAANPVFASTAGVGEVPYKSYNFDRWRNAVPAPNGYLPVGDIRGSNLGIGDFLRPADLFYHRGSGEIYIVDTGNNRIVVLDGGFALIRVIDIFTYNGGEYELANPTGIYITPDETMYICDQDNGVLVVSGKYGDIIRLIGLPEHNMIIKDADFTFRPSKVVVDQYGKIYIQALGFFEGLLSLTPEGEFISFFGANHVEMTWRLRMNQLWNIIRTRDQREAAESAVPIEYSSLFIDADNFIYATVVTVVEDAGPGANYITRLNPLGVNLLRNTPMPWLWQSYASLSDVTVDDNGVMTMLCTINGIIYQTDRRGNLMFAFGGRGHQLGLFRNPTAIMEVGTSLLVADAAKNNVTMFERTEFGALVHNAMELFNDGRYQENIEPWLQVTRSDANYLLAYTGLGRAYYQLEDYAQAMGYFRLANDREGYAAAYREYGAIRVRANFGWIFTAILLIAALVICWPRISKWRCQRKAGQPPSPNIKLTRVKKEITFCFYSLRHPAIAFDGVKWNGKGSMVMAAFTVIAFFLSQVLRFLSTGFIFNYNNPDNLSVISTFAITVGGFLVFWLTSIAVGYLMPSEATGRQYFIVGAYALMPTVLATLTVIVCSNFVGLQMNIFLVMLTNIGYAWTLVILLAGLFQVTQMRFGECVASLFLTAFGMLAVLIILYLLFSLYQQIYVFVYTLFSEIMFRV